MSIEEQAATERTAMELLPLVRKIAREVHRRVPCEVELDDLVGAGTLGLLGAIRRHDPGRNVQLARFASHRIRGAILDALRDMDSAPRDLRKRMKQLEGAAARVEARLGRPASEAEMKSASGLRGRQWKRATSELRALAFEPTRPSGGWGASEPLDEESLPSRTDQDPFTLCYRNEQREICRRALAKAEARERALMRLYYQNGWTMKRIGVRLRIDESRVSQLHAQVCERLGSAVRAMLKPVPTCEIPTCELQDRPSNDRLPRRNEAEFFRSPSV